MKTTFKFITDHGANHFKHGVSKDELRPIMQGLNIDFNISKAFITNAHIAVRYPISVSEKSDLRVSIPISAFDKTKYMFGDYKKVEMTEFDFEFDSETRMLTVFYNEKEVYKVEAIEGDGINAEAVFKFGIKNDIDSIGLNLSSLAILDKCIFNSKEESACKFEFNAKNKAVIINPIYQHSDEKVYGLIMPTYNHDQ